MSKQKYEVHINIGTAELRQGSSRYVGDISGVMKEQVEANDKPLHQMAKEMVQIGYAMGVIAGKMSDAGIEGFTLLLTGIKISLEGEDRKEKIQFAVWDKEGDLHTSEEGYRKKKGGQS